jgi:hypothetical protein
VAESALRAGARKRGFKGRRADRYVYGALNNMGFKRGNKSTRRGLAKAGSHPAVGRSMMG